MVSDRPHEYTDESPVEDVSLWTPVQFAGQLQDIFPVNSSEHTGEGPVEDISPWTPVQFTVQLQNVFPVNIVAERYPMDDVADIASIISTVHTAINLSGFEIDMDTYQAQIYLEVHVSFQQEPRLFAIRFKLLGIFNYAQGCSLETVQQFLQRESLSIMLPSARELLLSLCTRLQVPLVVLPLAQLVPSSSPPATETPLNN